MRSPKHPAPMGDAEEVVLAFKTFAANHWSRIHFANPRERGNEESKRGGDVVGNFPNVAALIHYAGALRRAGRRPGRITTLATPVRLGHHDPGPMAIAAE